ncbi:TPA: helix-turn-helix transcriptional regulator [Bacillus toyonensis]|nr:helix-turn-helix transcriptional regulator [Bacillus toyonensis]
MIGLNMNSLPHERKVSYQMIKYIRLCRNMTQEQFGEACKMDRSVLAKLERGELPLSPHYEAKIMDGIRTLNISQLELVSVKRVVELKAQRGVN